MPLREVQSLFMDAMYSVAKKSDVQKSNAEKFIKPSPKRSAYDCLASYRGSVRGGLLQALQDIYPVMHKLLGEQAFEGLSRQYINSNPSRSSNIAEYSGVFTKVNDNFADFIEFFTPLKNYPYMADVARLEWLWHEVFNETDDTPLNLEQLGMMPLEQHLELKFKRPHASRLLRSPWPIHRIWGFNQNSNQDRTQDNSQDESVELINGDYFLLIWRRSYEMQIDCLSKREWTFLKQLEQSACFSQAIEQFLQSHPNEDISELFSSAIGQGWIVDFI
jgi:Putative DNA-binding domain